MQYIPSKEERIKIYQNIKPIQTEQKQNNRLSANCEQIFKQHKKLSKQEEAIMIGRLTKDTKKQHNLRQQITKFLQINIEKKKIIDSKEKVEQRLLEAGKQLNCKKQTLRQKYLQQEKNTLKNIPSINHTKNKPKQFFHERIQNFIEKKQSKEKFLSNKYKPEFKPSLNSHSLFIADVNNGDKQFYERVQDLQKNRAQKIEALKKTMISQQLEEATFHPQINKKSKSLRNSQKSLKRIRNNNSSMKIQGQSSNHPSFKPSINPKSEKMMFKKQRKQISERLYHISTKQNLQRRLQRQKLQKQKYSYRPHINQNSKRILRNKQKELSRSPYEQTQQYEQIFVLQSSEQFQCPKLFQDQATSQQIQNLQQFHEEVHVWPINAITNKSSRRTSIE